MKETQQPTSRTQTDNDVPPIRDVIIAPGGGSGKILGESAPRLLSASQAQGVETVLIACNTDKRELERLPESVTQIRIGKNLTKGWGAGARPEVGARAAQESMEDIVSEIGDFNLLTCIVALGGGTGSGAGPEIVNEVAHTVRSDKGGDQHSDELVFIDKVVMVFAIMPFTMDGPKKMRRAKEAMEKLEGQDVLLLKTSNDKFVPTSEQLSTPIAELYARANTAFSQTIARVHVDLSHGLNHQNLDWRDILTVMRIPLEDNTVPRHSYVGVGYASGERRTLKALKEAAQNGIFDTPVETARGVVFTVRADGFNAQDLLDIQEFLGTLNQDAEVIYGYGDDKIKLDFEADNYTAVATIIAVGCDPKSVEQSVGAAVQLSAPPVEETKQVGPPKPANLPTQTPTRSESHIIHASSQVDLKELERRGQKFKQTLSIPEQPQNNGPGH